MLAPVVARELGRIHHRCGVVVIVVTDSATGSAWSAPLVPLVDQFLEEVRAAPLRRFAPPPPTVWRAEPPRVRWGRGRPRRRLLARGGRPARHSSWYGGRLRRRSGYAPSGTYV
jgi:hypothetical protein